MVWDTEALRPGEWLVTPTRRLAHHLKSRWDAELAAQGRRVWRTPLVLDWRELIERMFASDRAEGRLHARWLDGVSAALKWEILVRNDAALGEVLAPAGLGRAALRSWQRLHEYCIPLAALEEGGGPEPAAFRRWVGEYRAWLERGSWVDPAQASTIVGADSLEGALRFVGFDLLTPEQDAFIERLRAAGATVQVEPATRGGGAAGRVRCLDRRDEYESAARWAAARLDERGGQRLAIVVPGLRHQREGVRRVLEQVFTPERVAVQEPGAPVFDVSAARSLAQQPLVDSALDLIDAMVHRENPGQGRTVVTSAYCLAAREEAPARARLDAWIRRDAGGRLRLHRLARIAAERNCPLLGEITAAGLALAEAWPRHALPSDWSANFHQLLRAMGWPGEDLASAEYQAWQRWQQLLADFGAGNEVLGSITAASALRGLRDIAAQALFEPEQQGAALLVIDPETCVGMQFDAIWVCGLDASNWPGPAAPDPFLPRTWQLRRGVPGASAEIELQSAERRLSRLLSSAPELVLSHAQFDEDAPLLPSPLLEGIPALESYPRWAEPLPAAAMFEQRPALERLADGRMPALSGAEARKGGARILELQAACPLRAAAEIRLGALALEDPAPGIDAATRGRLVHEVLAATWRQLRSRAALADMPEEERARLLCGTIRKCLDPLLRHADGIERRLLELEAAWLEERAGELLAADLQREDFEIDALESERPLGIGGLTLRLRPDRVDRLADGSLAVVDYKTGADAEPAAWAGARPELPQLPLYALSLADRDVSAVAFGRLRSGETGYAGVARDAAVFTGLQQPGGRGALREFASWEEMLEAWRQRLESIAVEYRSGDARLPFDRARACRYCHLAALCRVGEVARSELSDEPE